MKTVLQELLSSSLLADATVIDVHDGTLNEDADSPLHRAAACALQSGTAELTTSGDDRFGAVIATPVYRGAKVVSIVAFGIAPKTDGAGVFEIWAPTGQFGEIGLHSGYFAHLERFSNVSSFVRFEHGSGLPGQAWASGKPVIHDRLPDHPGFLRAAGASAGLLQTAVAIPVLCQQELKSVVTLISAAATPLAAGYEVWDLVENEFILSDIAYQGLAAKLQLEPGTRLDLDHGLAGLAKEHGGAITCQNESFLAAGRDGQVDASLISGGLAIPVFSGEQLTSVLTFLF